MSGWRWLLAAIHLSAMLLLSESLMFADDEPSADQVIARYMDAIGANRFSSITTFAEHGEMFGALTSNKSEHAVFDFYFKSPNLRFSSSITAANRLISLRGCDGRIAWFIDSRMQRSEFTPKAGKEFDCEKGFDPMPSGLLSPKKKTRLIKKKEIAGRSAWEVSVYDQTRHVHETYYFDAETYLLVRVEMQGSHRTYSDYRNVAGFKLPFKTTNESRDLKLETTVREVVIDGPIDDARFIEPTVKDGVLMLNTPASRKVGGAESANADSPKPTTVINETESSKTASETMPHPAGVTEVNFPNFTVCTIPELQQTVPELHGLKPAADQTQLPDLLDKVGAKTVEIARNTPNLISRETVTEAQQPAAVMRYDYLILNRIQEKAVYLDEYRVDLKTGEKFETDQEMKGATSTRAALERASQDLAAMQSGRRPISQGFATSWVYFYPFSRQQATFRFLGEQKMDGHRTMVLAFAQKPQSVTSPALFLYQGKSVPMFIQGVAWVDASDFHIWRLRTDLLAPLPEVSLHRLTADTQFKPTRVEEIPSLISLPHEVKVTSVVSGSTRQEVHSYSEYRLFRARSKVVLNP